MNRLDGKVAVVTGAARGLGASIARAIIAAGGLVLLTDLLEEEGNALAAELGPHARFQRHDVSRRADWLEAVAIAEHSFGPVTILVNNAAKMDMAKFEDLAEETFRRVFEVNELGCFLGMQAVLPSMRKAHGGSIVNISSIAAMHPSAGIAYSSSKWAIRGMTKCVAYEHGAEGVRANSVHPGWMRTPATAEAPLEQVGKLIPLRQVGETADVAKLVVFLASDDANLITGSEYVIDGGVLLLGVMDMLENAGRDG